MDEVFGDAAGTGLEDRNRLNRIYLELGLLTHEELGMSSNGEKVSGESQHVVEKI